MARGRIVSTTQSLGPRSLYLVPEDQAAVHERLLNWGRWSRGVTARGQVQSLEHRYRTPVTEEDDHTGRRSANPVDLQDALFVFDQVTLLTPGPRVLLHLWYVHRSPPGFIARKLKLPVGRLVDGLVSARYHVARLCDGPQA